MATRHCGICGSTTHIRTGHRAAVARRLGRATNPRRRAAARAGGRRRSNPKRSARTGRFVAR